MAKHVLIKDRICLATPTLTVNWEWMRVPTGRTKDELDCLLLFLNSYRFDRDIPDSWIWSMSNNGRFSVKQMTKLINEKTIARFDVVQETLHNSLVPKKLEVFVWRALKKRLPVMIELDKRGIDLHSIRCALCDDDLEYVEHALIFCKHSLDVWNRVCRWWGIGNFPNLSLSEILCGNNPFHPSCLGKQIWQEVEWVCAYYIWKNRNNIVFRGASWTAPTTLNEIQLKSFEWIATRIKGVKIDWLSNPIVYLNF
ncbi:uncharacterized protein [Rutidosis leptorrhynchoides]|uniref:uncharacterized protein n=1 Tax=Rutidosis leptorrhynchoides TaxID=125765 RepID=UPI003A99B8B9